MKDTEASIQRTLDLEQIVNDARMPKIMHHMDDAMAVGAQATELLAADRALDVCCICHESVPVDDGHVIIPQLILRPNTRLPCGHLMHVRCADKVLESAALSGARAGACPLCRELFCRGSFLTYEKWRGE